MTIFVNIGNEWDNIPHILDEFVGFVYEIENLVTGMKYIGQKKFWYYDKKKPGKYKTKNGKFLKDKNGKRILETRKTRIITKKETDWRNYWGSNDTVKEDIEKFGVNNFTRKIIKCCTTQMEMNIYETHFQILYYINGDWDKLYNGHMNLRGRVR